MKTFLSLLFVGLLIIVGLGFFGALIVYWLWDPVITSTFPGAVESGLITEQITFWHAYGLSMITAILFKNTSVQNNNSNN